MPRRRAVGVYARSWGTLEPMAADYPQHLLFVFGGNLKCVAANDEIWECTIRGFPGSTGGPANMTNWQDLDLDAYLTAAATTMAAWFADADSVLCEDANLRYLKCNAIGTNGKYLDQTTTHQHDFGSPVAGASPGEVPSYLSICMSWQTALVRGLASKGRIYPPNYCYDPDGAGITSADAGAIADSGVALLNAIQLSAGMNGGVFSPAVVSSQQQKWQYITGVRVGNIYDEQRRRRNAVPETYVSRSFS